MDWGDVVAVVALLVALMALPTAIQMFWGRATLRISFEARPSTRKEDVIILWCQLLNPPVTNRLLRVLHVEREEIKDALAHYQLRDEANDKLEFQANPYLAPLYDVTAESQRTRIPPSDSPYVFRVVTINVTRHEVFTIPRDGEQRLIRPGLYKVMVEVKVDGSKTYKGATKLLVQDHDPYAYFVDTEHK